MADDSVTVQFEPPPEHLAQLIERIQRDLGKSVEDAVRLAAYYLAQSLGASTKSAPKMRKLRKNHGSRKGFDAETYPTYIRIYQKDGKIFPYYLKAGTEETDRRRPIRRAGLAKSSWKWMLGKLGRPERAPQAEVAGAVSVTKIGNTFNPGWMLENKLSYIQSAIRHSGRRPIETAFSRAVTAGNRAIDRRRKTAAK